MLKNPRFRGSAERSNRGCAAIMRDAADEVDAYFAMKKIKKRADRERQESRERNKRNAITLPKLSWMGRP